jgi:hypothetical protein
MAWLTLIFGALLIAIGVGGQIFATRKTSQLGSYDRHLRKWVFTIGSLVIGLWIVAFSVAHALHDQHTGHW